MDSTAVAAQEAAVLGLAPDETDPVRIILAAQLRLRCCRQGHAATGESPVGSEIQRIITARDALLRQAAGRLAGRGLGR